MAPAQDISDLLRRHPVVDGHNDLLWELREEAELEATQWRELFELYPSAGITSERQVCFLARGLRPAGRGDFALEHEEAEMELLWVPVDDLVEAVLDGRVGESPIAVCVLAYDALRRRDRL